MSVPTRRRPQFHPLTVARVERLTDDAVAVTFDIPDDLAEDYRFKPGQALTLRRVDGGRDERRSYSICAPMGAAPRVGVREVPGGFFSSYLVHQVRPGDTIEVLPPSGTFTADLSVPGRPRLRRRRLRDHPGAVAGRHGAAGRPVDGHRLLRQPPHQHGDVRRRARRPEGPLRPPPAAGARALPRAARRRDHQRPAGRRPAARARRRTWSTPSTWTTGGCAGRTAWSTDARALLTELGVPSGEGAPGALLRRRRPAAAGARRRGGRHRAQQPGHRRPRRPDDHPGPPPRRAGPRLRPEGARRPALRLQGRRLRHLPGAGHRRRGRDAAQLRPGGRARSRPATCSPARRCRCPTRSPSTSTPEGSRCCPSPSGRRPCSTSS